MQSAIVVESIKLEIIDEEIDDLDHDFTLNSFKNYPRPSINPQSFFNREKRNDLIKENI